MSNKKLSLELLLKLTEQATGPLKKVMQGSQSTSKALAAARDQLKALQRQQSDIKGYRTANIEIVKQNRALRDHKATLADSTGKLEQQQQVHSNLRANLRQSEKQYRHLTKAMFAGKGESEEFRDQLQRAQITLTSQQQAFERSTSAIKKYRGRIYHANNQITKLNKNQQRSKKNLDVYRDKLDQAGISTDQLRGKTRSLRQQQELANRTLEKQKTRLTAVAKLQQKLAKTRSAYQNVRGRAGSLAMQGSVAGAAGGYFFKTQFLDRAAEFETYRTTLETVEGSEAKASKAMNWVSDFTARTPFELAEVTEAYVKLRSYGLEPANGLLKTLGNTGSAMGKPMMQAVEAISDAITGENERLKEFGIIASKDAGDIIYEYTDRFGEQRQAVVDASNRKMIESTLTAIWNDKYAGAMDKQSRTWRGLVSNAADQWTRFTTMVMDQGLFDWMKGKLGGLMDQLNAMYADGRLQAWAETTGAKLMAFAEGAWQVGSAISSVTSSIASAVGGWENFIYLLAAIKLAPLVSSLFGLGGALLSVGKFALPLVATGLKAIWALMAANPIGLIVTAIVGAAALVYKYWEPIKEFFGGLWDSIFGEDSDKTPAVKVKQQLDNSNIDTSTLSAAAAMPLDTRAPLQAGGAASGGSLSIGQISVHAAPGMDEQALAMMVRSQIEQYDRQRAAGRRSSLSDYE